jgi:zinc transport system substrate-binding protein
MSWSRTILLVASLLVVLSHISLAEQPAGKIRIFVSILPQAYFVERIGGAYVDVEVLVGPGQSPATYEPTPKQMAKLAQSQIYFRIGVPFENVMVDRISTTFKNLTIVDTRKGIKLLFFKDSHAHGTGAPDPHIWLDPKRVKIQASTICDTFTRIDPTHASYYINNLRAFHADLDMVDAKIAKMLNPLKGKEFFVFHPSFGYFADAYALKQIALETEGKEPSAKQLASLIDRAKRYGVKVIFVQPQFSTKTAKSIASAIGGTVIPLDPLARDFLKNIEAIAMKLKKSLSAQ